MQSLPCIYTHPLHTRAPPCLHEHLHPPACTLTPVHIPASRCIYKLPPAYTSPCIYNHPLACTRRLCAQAPPCTYNPSSAYTKTSLHIQVPPCLYKHLPSYMYKRTPAYTSSLLHTQRAMQVQSLPCTHKSCLHIPAPALVYKHPLAYTSIPCMYNRPSAYTSNRLHTQAHSSVCKPPLAYTKRPAYTSTSPHRI
jgi:hypothetical protein